MIKTRLKHRGKPQYLLLFYCLFSFLAIYLAFSPTQTACSILDILISNTWCIILKKISNTNVPKKLSNS